MARTSFLVRWSDPRRSGTTRCWEADETCALDEVASWSISIYWRKCPCYTAGRFLLRISLPRLVAITHPSVQFSDLLNARPPKKLGSGPNSTNALPPARRQYRRNDSRKNGAGGEKYQVSTHLARTEPGFRNYQHQHWYVMTAVEPATSTVNSNAIFVCFSGAMS